MTSTRLVLAGYLVLGVLFARPVPVAAQDAPGSDVDMSAARCAPRLSTAVPDQRLTIVGSQEGDTRSYYGVSDVLLIDGGLAQGVGVGQEFFVRRIEPLTGDAKGATVVLHTAGWVRIVDAEKETSVALVSQACDGLHRGDFLEVMSWVEPPPPQPPASPDYDRPGLILFGLDGRTLIAPRDHFVTSLGTDDGIQSGQWLTVFRPALAGQRAVTELGEAVAVVVEAESTTAVLIRSRDAVQVGDLVAPQR